MLVSPVSGAEKAHDAGAAPAAVNEMLHEYADVFLKSQACLRCVSNRSITLFPLSLVHSLQTHVQIVSS